MRISRDWGAIGPPVAAFFISRQRRLCCPQGGAVGRTTENNPRRDGTHSIAYRQNVHHYLPASEQKISLPSLDGWPVLNRDATPYILSLPRVRDPRPFW